jgi:hyaluronate lyase
MSKFRVSLAVAGALLGTGCGGGGGGERPSSAVATEAPADAFQQGLQSTQELFLGTQGERGQAMYKPYFAQIHANAKQYADTIVFDRDRQLWDDLPTVPDTNGIMFIVFRLKTMSQAYITPGTMYLDAGLLQKIRQGLDVFVTRLYPEGGKVEDGWYGFQIAAPQELMAVIANLDSYLSADLKARIVGATRTYLPSIDVNLEVPTSPQTTANRVDLAWAMLVRGFASRNAADIEAAKEAFFDSKKDRFASIRNAPPYSAGAYRYATVDSFRRDGSYVFHGDLPYSNGYGLDLLNRSAEMLLILNGTSFDFGTTQKDAILAEAFTQLNDGWLPWIRDGIGLDAAAGRAVYRGFEQNHGKGHWALEGLLKYYRLADLGSDPAIARQRKAAIARFVKSFITNERSYYAKYGANDDAVAQHDFHTYATRAVTIKLANEIMNDAGVAYVKEPLPGTTIQAETDRFVHRTNDFAFAVAGHSYRTGNFEIVAGEGARACYSADGMTYLHDDDLDQYMDYWVAFDADRPAGVTNDASSPVDHDACSWSANSRGRVRKGGIRWAGGVAAGAEGFGTYGMDYKDWHWTTAAGSNSRIESPFVEARKSWFAFGDVILALGSGIKCNGGCDRSRLATTLDNRKLNGSGSNLVVINGSTWQGQASVPDVKTMHISGNVATSTLGIVLPDPQQLDIVKETLSGDWMTLSPRSSLYMKGTKVTGQFLRTALPHAAATNDSYAYFMLPGKTAAETTAFAANPPVKVLANTPTLHAASGSVSRTFAMNVFAAPSASFVTASSTLLRDRFTAAGNVNTPLTGGEAQQLFNAAASEQFYGVDGYVKTTGGVSLITRLDGDELTAWVSQPTRNVMSAVLDVGSAGYRIVGVLEGGSRAHVNGDGSKALVRSDLDYIGQRTLQFAWEGSGVTYKLRFRVAK